MKRHVLIGRLGAEDQGAIACARDEVPTEVRLLTPTRRLGHGIGQAPFDLNRLNVYPTELGLDLAFVAAMVHAADTRISRASESQDSWTREIRLAIPVSDPARWTSAAPNLITLLNFLTGDRWTVAFRSRPEAAATLATPVPARLLGPPFDGIALFSGGMDSLIGAIDDLEAGGTPLLVSHAGEGAVSKSQDDCFALLKAKYPGRSFDRLRVWMSFQEGLVEGVASENTTRGRSFLFFALGVFAATGLEGPFTLKVPENGLIALNVPLDPLRLGALSTRTTHPFYIARWNELLGALGIAGQIANPYWDKTKGEMAQGCTNPALLKVTAPKSLSCSSPSKGRWNGRPTEHCGYCLPCLIRRASLLRAWGPGVDATPYTLNDLTARVLDTRQAEGQQIRSFQLAAARLKKRPGLARLLIHKPGPLDDDPAKLDDLAGVYSRGLGEVDALLTGVQTKPS
ncbi:MAG: Qat anti-phage system QueC-like protein QatC [Caulobacter sp.]